MTQERRVRLVGQQINSSFDVPISPAIRISLATTLASPYALHPQTQRHHHHGVSAAFLPEVLQSDEIKPAKRLSLSVYSTSGGCTVLETFHSHSFTHADSPPTCAEEPCRRRGRGHGSANQASMSDRDMSDRQVCSQSRIGTVS